MGTMGDILATYTTQAQMSNFFVDKTGIALAASYGATGDGVTVDTTALQNALDSGAGCVFLEPGKTYVCGRLTAPAKNMYIWGHGSIIASSDATRLFDKNGSYRIALIGVTVTGVSDGIITNTTAAGKHYISGRQEIINEKTHTSGTFDCANFAGQADGASAPIGFVLHHYTDGILAQFDNVGDANTILRLKNANNSTRRSDKAVSFVGTGKFLVLTEHNYGLGYAQDLFYLSKDTEAVWTGVKGTATLWQNKAEDSTYAFRLKTTSAHRYLLDILNTASVRVLSVQNDATLTRAAIISDAAQTSGLLLQALKGSVQIFSETGQDIVVNGPIAAYTGDLMLKTGSAATDSIIATKPIVMNAVAAANVQNNSIFRDSADDVLKFKDAGGVLRSLY